jgi:hypothetical protein
MADAKDTPYATANNARAATVDIISPLIALLVEAAPICPVVVAEGAAMLAATRREWATLRYLPLLLLSSYIDRRAPRAMSWITFFIYTPSSPSLTPRHCHH